MLLLEHDYNLYACVGLSNTFQGVVHGHLGQEVKVVPPDVLVKRLYSDVSDLGHLFEHRDVSLEGHLEDPVLKSPGPFMVADPEGITIPGCDHQKLLKPLARHITTPHQHLGFIYRLVVNVQSQGHHRLVLDTTVTV